MRICRARWAIGELRRSLLALEAPEGWERRETSQRGAGLVPLGLHLLQRSDNIEAPQSSRGKREVDQLASEHKEIELGLISWCSIPFTARCALMATQLLRSLCQPSFSRLGQSLGPFPPWGPPSQSASSARPRRRPPRSGHSLVHTTSMRVTACAVRYRSGEMPLAKQSLSGDRPA